MNFNSIDWAMPLSASSMGRGPWHEPRPAVRGGLLYLCLVPYQSTYFALIMTLARLPGHLEHLHCQFSASRGGKGVGALGPSAMPSVPRPYDAGSAAGRALDGSSFARALLLWGISRRNGGP